MLTFRFLEFKVYQDSKQLHATILDITKVMSRDYFSLIDQMRRSALSICLNIAEGSAKESDKDFNRFLQNALGSVNELVACLDICLREKLITTPTFQEFLERSDEIAKQLGGLSRKLKS